jgi:hypothetical protein
VENLSRLAATSVNVTVEHCTSNNRATCSIAGTPQGVQTLAGGQKVSFIFAAPPTAWYAIDISALSGGSPTLISISYPLIHVLP